EITEQHQDQACYYDDADESKQKPHAVHPPPPITATYPGEVLRGPSRPKLEVIVDAEQGADRDGDLRNNFAVSAH
ncbi:MAG: hypothetical protein AAFY64_09895, partial [Pseudomonadota bacterium]